MRIIGQASVKACVNNDELCAIFSKESHNSHPQSNDHSYIDAFVNVDKHNMN